MGVLHHCMSKYDTEISKRLVPPFAGLWRHIKLINDPQLTSPGGVWTASVALFHYISLINKLVWTATDVYRATCMTDAIVFSIGLSFIFLVE